MTSVKINGRGDRRIEVEQKQTKFSQRHWHIASNQEESAEEDPVERRHEYDEGQHDDEARLGRLRLRALVDHLLYSEEKCDATPS